MEDGPKFEIKDGAVVHPLIAPLPGEMSAAERLEAERTAGLVYCLRGGGGDLAYLGGGRSLGRER
jgi:hypothetical protein